MKTYFELIKESLNAQNGAYLGSVNGKFSNQKNSGIHQKLKSLFLKNPELKTVIVAAGARRRHASEGYENHFFNAGKCDQIYSTPRHSFEAIRSDYI